MLVGVLNWIVGLSGNYVLVDFVVFVIKILFGNWECSMKGGGVGSCLWIEFGKLVLMLCWIEVWNFEKFVWIDVVVVGCIVGGSVSVFVEGIGMNGYEFELVWVCNCEYGLSCCCFYYY